MAGLSEQQQQDDPVWFVDATVSLTAQENEFVWTVLTMAIKSGLLAGLESRFGPDIARDIYNKIAAANAGQGCKNAQAFCLQQGIPFGGETGTMQ